jgi:crotonobetainyl-CoA:carnitine CoA-transferase CaiB-like acyl-CoA transferase
MSMPNSHTPEQQAALEGWRVLELTDATAWAFCAKLLADLSAEVLRIEPPGGHPSRRAAQS